MTVKELRDFLDTLIEQGKGDYLAVDSGYDNEITMEETIIDDIREEVYLG